MSVRVMADVWEHGPDDATLVSVLLVLANYSDDSGGNCFPGLALIAKRTRYSERTVIRAIADLEEQGWITVLQRGSGRPPKSAVKEYEKAEYRSQFQLNVSKLKGCQPVTVPKDERVTMTTGKGDTEARKGDNDDKPPHPLKGVSVIDPSPIRGKEVPLREKNVTDLCHLVGIFDPSEQNTMCTVVTVYKRASGKSLNDAVEHMVGRWLLYQEGVKKREWSYGSAYAFFKSGFWDKPDLWAKETVQKQDPLSKLKFFKSEKSHGR